MRAPAFLLGLTLGLSSAVFVACPPPAGCNAASCPTGCCDAAGRCQSAGNQTCGRNGQSCVACSLTEACNAGVCQSTGAGAGAATGGGTAGTGGGFAAGGGSGTGGGSAGSFSVFLTNFANAYCQYASRCNQIPAAGVADCAALLRPFFAISGGGFSSLGGSERSVAAGYATFDGARGQACLAAVAAASCSTGPSADCSDLTRPAAALNGACFNDFDCVDRGLTCNGAPCMRRCTAGGNLGEACRRDGSCTSPFVCVSGTCANEPAPGTACSGDTCGPRQRCTQGRCEALPTVGMPCPDFRCAPGAYCSSSTCVAVKPVNSACFSSQECESGLLCRAQRCSPPGDVGAPCTFAGECLEGLSCNNRQCAMPGLMGARCVTNFDCAPGLGCDDVLKICRATTTVASGGACSSTQRCTSDQCRNKRTNPDGGVGTPGTCGQSQTGDACATNGDCANANYCESGSRTCQAAGAATPCNSASNCRSTDYCTTSNVCATRAAAGQVCDSNRSDSCAAANELCLETSTAGVSRCQRLPTLGESCVSRCAMPSACVGGTCVATGRIGQPCAPSFPIGCLQGDCRNVDGGLGGGSGAVCAAPMPNGSDCRAETGCQSGHCDRTRTSSFAGVCTAACN